METEKKGTKSPSERSPREPNRTPGSGRTSRRESSAESPSNFVNARVQKVKSSRLFGVPSTND